MAGLRVSALRGCPASASPPRPKTDIAALLAETTRSESLTTSTPSRIPFIVASRSAPAGAEPLAVSRRVASCRDLSACVALTLSPAALFPRPTNAPRKKLGIPTVRVSRPSRTPHEKKKVRAKRATRQSASGIFRRGGTAFLLGLGRVTSPAFGFDGTADEAVADADHRLYRVAARADLGAEGSYVHVERARVAVVLLAPHVV